ncbi:MAG: polyphosphate kinase 1 [Pseudomonadota bacterium]
MTEREPSELYINRELSMLEFNKRVLALAQDPALPLLERLRFLCITCTNLDEFFEIRVAALKQRMEIGALAQGPEQLPAVEVFQRLRSDMLEVVRQQYDLLNGELFPQLAETGVNFIRSEDWTEEQSQWLHTYFNEQVVPVLTPLTFDPSRPFPRLLSKSLNFVVRLHGKDAYGRRRHRGMLQAPRSLPRIIPLPDDIAGGGSHNFVFLSSVIRMHVEQLFPGLTVDGCYQFRVTRNSNLYVDEEEVSDLVGALEGQLEASRYGGAVRIEVGHECPPDLQEFLLNHFELDEHDMYLVDGPVNLNRLATVCDIDDLPELLYPPFMQGIPKEFGDKQSVMAALDKKNVLLFHPFQSFAPVIEFIREASVDPDVLAIKITLYRSGPNSPIVDHLVSAARAGKEVTVVIELMARFDEAANIGLANRLQEAGAHVVYGLVGYKTHAKMTLVVRREKGELSRYVHLGTGNYHHSTSKVYTDYGFFSGDKKLGEDVHKVFMQLTSLTQAEDLKLMMTSPFNLFDGVIEKIRREAEHAKAGREARIIAKVNALNEKHVVQELYAASQAGVKIDLIIRGVCSLRPGVPGLSDNIRVVSILGRFLEHSRVYCFHNGGDDELYCASADWMERNLLKRNESCFPVRQKSLRKRLKKDLQLYLDDNSDAWELQGDGSYQRVSRNDGDAIISAQDTFLEWYAN